MTQNNLGLALGDQTEAGRKGTEARHFWPTVTPTSGSGGLYEKTCRRTGRDPEQRALRSSNQAPDARDRGHGALAQAVTPTAWRWRSIRRRPAAAVGDDPEQLGRCAQQPSEPDRKGNGALRYWPQSVTPTAWLWRSERKRPPAGLGGDQNNLGLAPGDQRQSGRQGPRARRLAQTVTAYRLALEVYTKKTCRRGWAMTRTTWALRSSDQTSRTPGTEARRFY